MVDFIKKHFKLIIIIVAALLVIAGIISFFVIYSNSDPSHNPEETTATEQTDPVQSSASEVTEDTTEIYQTTAGTLPSESTVSSSETTEITEPPVIESDFPLLLLRFDEQNISIANESGVSLVKGYIKIPVFSNNNDNEIITAINDSIRDFCTDTKNSDLKTLVKLAEGDATSSQPSVPFTYNFDSSVMLSSDTCVSVLFNVMTNSGSGEVCAFHANSFSVEKGTLLTLDDIFGGNLDKAIVKISERIVAEIDGSDKKSEYYPDYKGLIELFGLEDRFYFSEDGLKIFYVPYEIAGSSLGVLEFTIPYSELNGIISFNPIYYNSQYQ